MNTRTPDLSRPHPDASIRAHGAPVDMPCAPRFDMYRSIHKGLRSRMADTLAAVGRMDWLDDPEREAALILVGTLLEQCRAHLDHENRFVHTAIERRLPGAAGPTEADHIDHIAAIGSLQRKADAVRAAAEPGAAASASLALYRELAVFVAENFLHMQVEETRNNALLWSVYSDEELIEIHDALVATIPAEQMPAMVQWIVPALAPTERTEMLLGARTGMPAEAFDRLLAAVREVLGEREWAKLSAALGVLH